MTNKKDEIKTLHIEAFDQKGEVISYEIEIPASWKITFGPLSQSGPHVNCMALRIYEAKEKQRACFINVISFYDKSIPIHDPNDPNRDSVKIKQEPQDVRELSKEALIKKAFKGDMPF